MISAEKRNDRHTLPSLDYIVDILYDTSDALKSSYHVFKLWIPRTQKHLSAHIRTPDGCSHGRTHSHNLNQRSAVLIVDGPTPSSPTLPCISLSVAESCTRVAIALSQPLHIAKRKLRGATFHGRCVQG